MTLLREQDYDVEQISGGLWPMYELRQVGKHREDNWANPLRVIDLIDKYGTVNDLCNFSRALSIAITCKFDGRHARDKMERWHRLQEKFERQTHWRAQGIRPWIELDS